ncbi:MAG: tetratricopeptide repeat protein [Pseudomonadota bacterium]
MKPNKRLKAGIAAHQKGKLRFAEAAYREVLAAEPNQPDALHFYGMLKHQQRDNESAMKLIRRSLEANPNNPAALNNLGNILVREGEDDEAANSYLTAIVLDPTHAEAFQNLGVVHRRQGDHKRAIEALTRAVELAPKNAEAAHNLGICYVLVNQVEKAADAFQSAVELDLRGGLNVVWHARVLCALGREEVAAKHLRRHLKEDPNDPIAKHQLAAIQGDWVDRASDDYVRQHFNDFARSFNDTLESLQYKAPEIVGEEVGRWTGDRGPWGTVIDLGCGTGLLGPFVKEHSTKLIGIDLSPKMLVQAAELNSYAELHEAELVSWLEGLEDGSVDLALAADTLCYFGPLEDVFTQLARVLKPGAALIATVEEEEGGAGPDGKPGDYALHNHGRYSHSVGYIKRAAEAAGMSLTKHQTRILRREVGEDVQGLIITVEKPAA